LTPGTGFKNFGTGAETELEKVTPVRPPVLDLESCI